MSVDTATPNPAPAQAPEVYFKNLSPGDKLPSMVQASSGRPDFAFDTLAGRYQLYAFFLSAGAPEMRATLETVLARADLFDGVHCTFTGVTVRPEDQARYASRLVAGKIQFAWDYDFSMSIACGAIPIGATPGANMAVERRWILVDPSLHVIRVFPMNTTSPEEVLAAIEALPPPDLYGGVQRPAPILMLPNVFEPELCRELIDRYNARGGLESGVHRDGAGVLDRSFKSRKDYIIDDPELILRLKQRLARRVTPEVEKLFFHKTAFIERHIVGAYAAEDGGHFMPHTDNGPGLTAHRRYAVSVNLTGDFEGGEVVFPEYNMQGYKAPPGWAVVFPCAILHAVRRVTSGVRYAYLPFIYDEAGARIREAELAKARAREEAAGG